MAARKVFTEALKARGILSAMDVLVTDILTQAVETVSARLGAKPGAVVFLQPKVSVLMARLKTRGQTGDEVLSKERMVDNYNRHEELLRTYIDMGYDVLLVRTNITPDLYDRFLLEVYSYAK